MSQGNESELEGEDDSRRRRIHQFREEMVDPSSNELFLHHSDHPNYILSTSLLNERNYSHWKRSVEVSLMAKNKLGFVTGTCARPTPDSGQYNQWERCNSMVISWLLHSVEKEIAESVLYCKTANQIWTELATRFGKSNRTRLFQVQREISFISQGSSSVTTYFTKLKKLWDEYMMLIEGCACECGSTVAIFRIMQDQQVVQFLMGLSDSFNGIRGNVLMMSPPPNLDEVYQIVLQEEQQRSISNGSKSDTESMVFAAQRYGQRNSGATNSSLKEASFKMDICDALHAELSAIHKGLVIANRLGFKKIQIQTDSMNAVKLLHQRNLHPHRYFHLLEDCRRLLYAGGWSTKIIHVPRTANRVADLLANASLSLSTNLVEFTSINSMFADALELDRASS